MNNIAFHFRAATAADMDLIFDFLLKTVTESGISDRFVHDKEYIEKSIFELKLAEVLLVLEGEEPIGLAMFSVTNRNFTLFSKPGIFLHDIYVVPSHRRKGAATAIFTKLKEIAEERNLGRIDLIVLKNNINALKLYDSLPDMKEVDIVKYMRITLS